MVRTSIIKPDSRENKTTIQVSKDVKEALTKIGLKGETYNNIISRLIAKSFGQTESSLLINNQSSSMPKRIKIGSSIVLSKYARVSIAIRAKINEQHPAILGYQSPPITLEISYNKPNTKDDNLYQLDLKVDKIIFNNEVYGPKEFFGVLQKDMVYSQDFVYYYLKSVLEVIKIEFKKSNYFFNEYNTFFDIARWRTFLLNSKLSPEILSSDIESILADLKNEKSNKILVEDVKNSFYNKTKEYGRDTGWD